VDKTWLHLTAGIILGLFADGGGGLIFASLLYYRHLLRS
jgi:hypothetical protein